MLANPLGGWKYPTQTVLPLDEGHLMIRVLPLRSCGNKGRSVTASLYSLSLGVASAHTRAWIWTATEILPRTFVEVAEVVTGREVPAAPA